MDRTKVGTRPPRKYTREMDEWIKSNADLGIFKNQKHFVDVFNAIHGMNVTQQQMNTHLYRIGVVVQTKQNTSNYTPEMDKWLIDNCAKYDNDWVQLSKDFNEKFNVDYSNCRLQKYCTRSLKIHIPKEKKGQLNKGTFTVGHRRGGCESLPLGTIRTYSSGTSKILYVKVKMPEGDSGKLCENNSGHNFKRPWWIPLKEKVWMEHNGEIPKGFSVVHLDRDYTNCDINNLVLADKRGLAMMASYKWWSDNVELNRTAITFCNLYMAAKDNGVFTGLKGVLHGKV